MDKKNREKLKRELVDQLCKEHEAGADLDELLNKERIEKILKWWIKNGQ